VSDYLTLACAGMTCAGLLQATIGWGALARFRGTPTPPQNEPRPPLSILKPLHGDEILLEEALASLCAQDYPNFQIVFGIQDPADAALPVVRRLRKRFPSVDMTVVVDRTRHGSNGKVANLINMLPHARHDLLVIADSDIHAPPGYLASVAASLTKPGVGMVTTLWAGLAGTESLVAKIGAAYINDTFLPGALLARSLGRQDCLGATMAIRRATLDAVGGFEALANHVADDALLGKLVREQGLQVALADTIPVTTVPETALTDLFEHELRWARTTRSVEPLGFALAIVQYPLFWAALMVGFAGGAEWAWAAFACAWWLRGLIAHGIDRALKVASPLSIWCLPFRDLLSVMVMLASYGSRRVAWRGQVHQVTSLAAIDLAPGKG
jgi:ceramide glucosyltransferase